MKTTFCTISTESHIGKTKALFESLRKNRFEGDLFCLIIDCEEIPNSSYGEIYLTVDELIAKNKKPIQKKYKSDKLRWALKAVLLEHLILKGFEKVIYTDNDIYFYENPDFLLDDLDKNNILLSPHFYNSDSKIKQNWLEANFTVGLFNAGFIGVNSNALDFLKWWQDCCIYNIKKAFWRGLFDDQKYLDLVPIKFEKVLILKHKGCNVAGWNLEECKRTISENENVIINQKYPIVFIHFTPLTVEKIRNGEDYLLQTNLDEYQKALLENGFSNHQLECKKMTKSNIYNYCKYLWWIISRQFEK